MVPSCYSRQMALDSVFCLIFHEYPKQQNISRNSVEVKHWVSCVVSTLTAALHMQSLTVIGSSLTGN